MLLAVCIMQQVLCLRIAETHDTTFWAYWNSVGMYMTLSKALGRRLPSKQTAVEAHMKMIPVVKAHAGDGLAVLGHARLVLAVRGVKVLHAGIPPDDERQLTASGHVCPCSRHNSIKQAGSTSTLRQLQGL